VTPLVEPRLFGILTNYVNEIARGEVKATPRRGATSPALTFCENFYAQFFQNRLKRPIQRIDSDAKKKAVGLRLELKDKNENVVIIRLITWFEALCDKHSTILAMNYGTAGEDAFFEFHNEYLPTLLERIVAWAQLEKQADVEGMAKQSLSALKTAMEVF